MERSYHAYRNDDLDYLYEGTYKGVINEEDVEEEDVVGFWCDIYQNFPDYKELSKLAILLKTLTPDMSECERGVSTMNYVKNELRTALTEKTLNACMVVALDRRLVTEFPFIEMFQ